MTVVQSIVLHITVDRIRDLINVFKSNSYTKNDAFY